MSEYSGPAVLILKDGREVSVAARLSIRQEFTVADFGDEPIPTYRTWDGQLQVDDEQPAVTAYATFVAIRLPDGRLGSAYIPSFRAGSRRPLELDISGVGPAPFGDEAS